MRYGIIIFILGISLSCLARVNVVIRLDPDVQKKLVHFTVPMVNGECFLGNFLKIKPDARGVIRLKIDLDSPGILYFGTSATVGLLEVYLEPDKDITINIGKEVVFEGPLETENAILYHFRRITHTSDWGKKLRGISSADVYYDTLMQTIDRDLRAYEALAHEKKLSPAFREFITENIRTYHHYYGVHFLHQQKLVEYCYRTTIRNDSLINSDWGKVWNKLNTESMSSGARISYWFSESVFWYIQAYRNAFLKEARASIGPDMYGAYLDSLSTLADRYLSVEDREVFIPQLIYNNVASGITFYVPEMVDLYKRFKSEFPASPTIPLLAPKINEIIRYNAEKIPDPKIDDKVIFIDGVSDISTFDELMKPFKDKVVFIDIWATWCGPCIEEFAFYSGIRKLQKENKDFAVLFISRDKTSDEGRWRKFVKKRALAGYHVMPNPALEKDLRSLIQWTAIPRYAIVDKAGQIVNSEAPSPSAGRQLIDEIKAYLAR